MTDTSPTGPNDPKEEISEEELDDFLAGAGTVSREKLPDPTVILGEALDVPTENKGEVLATLNKLQQQAKPAPAEHEDIKEDAATDAEIVISTTEAPGTKEALPDVSAEPIPDASVETAMPESPKMPPAPKRRFSLRRLGRRLFGK